jgi:hypothetical protein
MRASAARLVLAVGNGRVRQRAASSLGKGAVFATALHPAATIGPWVSIGDGRHDHRACQHHDRTRGQCLRARQYRPHYWLLGDFCNLGPSASLACRVTVQEGANLGVSVSFAPGVVIGASLRVHPAPWSGRRQPHDADLQRNDGNRDRPAVARQAQRRPLPQASLHLHRQRARGVQCGPDAVSTGDGPQIPDAHDRDRRSRVRRRARTGGRSTGGRRLRRAAGPRSMGSSRRTARDPRSYSTPRQR